MKRAAGFRFQVSSFRFQVSGFGLDCIVEAAVSGSVQDGLCRRNHAAEPET
jgi:hypothetical protein